MEITLDAFGTLLLRVGIVVIMLSMGLQITGPEIMAAVRQRRLMAKVLLANLLLLPLVALAISRLVNMPEEIAAGFLIASVAPGATLTPKLAEIARANLSLAVGVTFVLAIVSIVATPFMASLLLPDSPTIQLDPRSVISILILFQLIPLLAGLAIHHWRPDLARRLRRPSILLANLLFFLVVAFNVIRDFPNLVALPPLSLAAMVLMTFASLFVGWYSGGQDEATRMSLALGTGVEFTGMALLIVTTNFPGTAAGTAVIAFALVLIAINTALAFLWSRRATPAIDVAPVKPSLATGRKANLGLQQDSGS